MELCNLTLHDYIANAYGDVTPAFHPTVPMTTAFVRFGCSILDRGQNIWTIASHIAKGLEFMHDHMYVHRDLKPSNGMAPLYWTLLMSVLYSIKENQWKLADFGLSAEGTSKSARTTKEGSGTPRYRAPELVVPGEILRFTNKVDIWALGCVLYELTTLHAAFNDDWYIEQYSRCLFEPPPIETTLIPPFLQHHLSGTISDLLNKDSKSRPSAASIQVLCSSYSRILGLPVAQTLLDASTYPTYVKWKHLVSNSPTDQEFLYELMSDYKQKGETEMFLALRSVLLDDPAVKKRKQTNSERVDLNVWQIFAEKFLEKENYTGAITAYENAIQEDPMNFWLWHGLCRTYLEIDDHDGAMAACKSGIARLPCNWSPTMELSNLAAMAGDYNVAINTYMRLETTNHPDSSLWHNLLSEVDLVHPSPNADEALISHVKQYGKVPCKAHV